MQEVRQRGPQAAQEARQREGHPQLLRPSAKLERLDPGRHEVGTASHGRHAQLAPLPSQRSEESRDVGLVARASPPEGVGVDDDHAAASS